MLRIELLGPPRVCRGDEELQVPRRKTRAVLYFAAESQLPVLRPGLLAMFWPDLERSKAGQSLRTTLHGLKQVLGESIRVENDAISLSPEVIIDTRRVEAVLGQENPSLPELVDKLELYRGDFLEHFELEDNLEFETWLVSAREHYRRLVIRGWGKAAQIARSQEEYDIALQAIDRALALDPLQEDMHRERLRLLYLAGDRAGAIRSYDELRRRLDEELGVPPMRETRSLYDAILADRADELRLTRQPMLARSKLTLPPELKVDLRFTGRQVELEELSRITQEGKLALVEGEPGIGKTRLVTEFLAPKRGFVLVGSGHELESSLPYQPMIEALRSLTPPLSRLHLSLPEVWQAEITRLLPETLETTGRKAGPLLGGIPGEHEEQRLWEAIHQLLLALSGQKPVYLFIDDLQWADPSTLGLLGYLVRRATSNLTFLAACRPVTARSPLAALIQALSRNSRLGRVRLDRLNREAIQAIVQSLHPAAPPAYTDWLTSTSEGIPLIVRELVRYSRETGVLTAEGLAALEAGRIPRYVPTTIYSMIEARLANLSEPTRRFLDAAVAVGRDFEYEVVLQAAAVSETAALDALDELVTLGLIMPLRDRPGMVYTFDHNLTMEVALQESGEARHRMLHRRVGEALERLHPHARGELAGRIAFHYTEGGASQQAAPYAYRAGQRAAELAAWKEAAAFFEQALAVETDPRQRREILRDLGEARYRAGDAARSSDAYQALITALPANSPEADRARIDLGQSYVLQARYAEAIKQAQIVLEGGRPEWDQRAELLWGTCLSLEGSDLAEAAHHLRHAEILSREDRDLPALAAVLFELGGISAQQGDLPEAIELYQQCLETASQAGNGTQSNLLITRRILALNNLGYHLHLLGDRQAEEYARQGLALAREHGILPLQTYLLSTLGEIALAGGDIDQAEAFFNEGLALAEEVTMGERVAGLTANLGLVAARRGQTSSAIHRLSTALAQADALGLQHLGCQVRIWLAPYLPQEEAARRLEEARQIAESGRRKLLLAEIQRIQNQI